MVLFHATNRTSLEIEEVVKMIRLNLYNQDLFCGAQAILWALEDLGVKPLPSLRMINRILNRNELTHRRTGKYEPKGTSYPKFPALLPNQTHQMDLVGPCYLTGPLRFYGINVIDAATASCGLHSSPSNAGQDVLAGAGRGPFGHVLAYRTTFKSTTPYPSSAARDIPELRASLFVSVYTMASNSGSSRCRNPGAMV
jgi:hypothetical protein